MDARVMDMTDPADRAAVELGYWTLFSPALQCFAQVTTPSMGWLVHESVTVFGAHDDGQLVGLLAVRRGDVYYPVLAQDRYEETLAALIVEARRVCGPLAAATANETILETAVAMGVGVERDGERLVFD